MADALFWNNLAEAYSQKPVDNPDAFERKIEHTKRAMTKESVVLDIGCGTGSLALRLADSGSHIHGLDVSEKMIEIANRKSKNQQVNNVTFHVGPFDPTFEALPHASLDGICAYSILHLVADRRGALDHIFSLLKPGGFFVSSTPCLKEPWIPYRPILAVMRWVGKAPMVKIFSKAELVTEMTSAGFVDIEQPDVGADKHTAFVVARKPG